MPARTRVGDLGLGGNEASGVAAGGETGAQSTPLSPSRPPPRATQKAVSVWPRSAQDIRAACQQMQGEEAGFSCVAAGRGGTAGSPAPGRLRRLGAPPASPSSLRRPKNGVASAPRSHSPTSKKRPPSGHQPLRLRPSPHICVGRWHGAEWGVYFVPIIGFRKQAKMIKNVHFRAIHTLSLWVCN